MMTIIEFIYDRKYPVAIAADGGSMKFPPNVFEQVVSDYEKYKAENLPISDVVGRSEQLPCDRCDGKPESEAKNLCYDCEVDLHGM
jgi:hypothetical protein